MQTKGSTRVKVVLSVLPLFFLITGAYTEGGDLPEGLSQETFEKVQAAVVRVCWLDGREIGSGVCVTPEGHVVIRNSTTPKVQPMLARDKVRIHFPDGQAAEGTGLGLSDEWGIAVAQVAGKGPWPHVDLDFRGDLNEGSPCIALAYVSEQHPRKPAMTTGKVTGVSADRWLTSNCTMDDFAPLFDLRGNLLGITTVRPLGDDSVQTHVAVIRELWNDLLAGHNVDKTRADSAKLPASTKESPRPSAGPTVRDADAVVIAKRTTVRVRPVKKGGGFSDHGWSGVVISSDGLVATCAHHRRVRGEQVIVYFSDGTQATGEILGTNRVTDIGLVQITDKGTWPFAKVGPSRTIAAGDKCFVSGYPASGSDAVEPVVLQTSVVEPDGYVWSSMLLTSAADYEIKPGFSGGGLFDADGTLIGVHEGKDPGKVGRHKRSEFFLLQWEDLTSRARVARPDFDDVGR